MNSYKFKEISIGLKESFEVTLDLPKVDAFIEITGDKNPIHLDNEYALNNGFNGRIVHGLLTASFFSTLAGEYLPGRYSILHSIDIQFSNPVYIDDLLTISGVVKYINEAYKQIEIEVKIINQNGVNVSKGKMKVGVIDE